jgi:hypothetical protein
METSMSEYALNYIERTKLRDIKALSPRKTLGKNTGNVRLRPHKRSLAAARVRRVFDEFFDENLSQEIDMIGTIARWGSNTLLVAMAVLTYAVFVLAK